MALLIFSLLIIDLDTYESYRTKILPVTDRYDVKVFHEYSINKVLNSIKTEDEVNRLAVFSFPSEKAKEDFFADVEYLAAKPLLLASTQNINVIIP